MGNPTDSTLTKHVIRVHINGTEKRYQPTRHYVYILQVRWSDYNEYVIYRKYSDFYTLQCGLLEKFPIEAGVIKTSDRVIPHLPERLIFSRSEVSKVANQRREDLAHYCSALTRLDQKIQTCGEVIDFFEARPDDINRPDDVTKKPERSRLITVLMPFFKRYKGDIEDDKELCISDPITLETYSVIADYNAADKSEVSLQKGATLEVFEKNCSGWWFVQADDAQGWAPASYLEPVSHPMTSPGPDPTYTGDLENYITTNVYTAEYSDEISFESDVVVEVMHKRLDGWWIISYNGEAGYGPAAYLTPYDNPHLVRSRTMKDRSAKLIPRKRSVKAFPQLKDTTPEQDLSLYRKCSKERNASRTAFKVAPPPPKPPRVANNQNGSAPSFVPPPGMTGSAKNRPETPPSENQSAVGEPLKNRVDVAPPSPNSSSRNLPPPAPSRHLAETEGTHRQGHVDEEEAWPRSSQSVDAQAPVVTIVVQGSDSRGDGDGYGDGDGHRQGHLDEKGFGNGNGNRHDDGNGDGDGHNDGDGDGDGGNVLSPSDSYGSITSCLNGGDLPVRLCTPCDRTSLPQDDSPADATTRDEARRNGAGPSPSGSRSLNCIESDAGETKVRSSRSMARLGVEERSERPLSITRL